jgi:hypothetical protein
MTHGKLEAIPDTWSDEQDGAFFGLVRSAFRPAFTSGATVLLMSYDDDGGSCPRSCHPSCSCAARTHTTDSGGGRRAGSPAPAVRLTRGQ